MAVQRARILQAFALNDAWPGKAVVGQFEFPNGKTIGIPPIRAGRKDLDSMVQMNLTFERTCKVG